MYEIDNATKRITNDTSPKDVTIVESLGDNAVIMVKGFIEAQHNGRNVSSSDFGERWVNNGNGYYHPVGRMWGSGIQLDWFIKHADSVIVLWDGRS